MKRLFSFVNKNFEDNVKIVVNENKVTFVDISERNTKFEELNNSPVGGHRGINKTYKRISDKYFWLNMKKT